MDFLSKITAAITLLWIEAASAAECVQAPTPKGVDTVQVNDVPTSIRMGSFGVGSLLIAAGLLRLKQAADTNGEKVKYGDGLWCLALGAFLASVPAVLATTPLADQEVF